MSDATPELVGPTTPTALVESVYSRYPERVAIARERLGRALTFAEKVLIGHADDPRGYVRALRRRHSPPHADAEERLQPPESRPH